MRVCESLSVAFPAAHEMDAGCKPRCGPLACLPAHPKGEEQTLSQLLEEGSISGKE